MGRRILNMRRRILGAVAVAVLASASLVAATGQSVASTSSATGGVMHYAGSYTGVDGGSGSPACEAAGKAAVASGQADEYLCNWVQSWIYDLYLIDLD
jgi:hypothetical protein